MAGRRLIWELYPSYILIVVLSIGAMTWLADRYVRRVYLEQTAADLEVRAILVEDGVRALLSPAQTEPVTRICRDLGRRTHTRITVILPSGKVIGDSEEEPARMDNHADRPEVVAALRGERGVSTRYSFTLRKNMMYVAVPIAAEGGVVAVVRTSVPVTAIDTTLRAVYLRVALAGLVTAVFAGVLSFLAARRIARPLEEIREGAERFSRGAFETRLHVPGTLEIGAVAETMNQMAERLDEKIRAVVRQRNELEAVLSGMVEGVIALDNDGRVMSMNQAAGRMLGVEPAPALTQRLSAVVRNAELLEFASRTLSGRETADKEIVLRGNPEKFIQTHGTLLRDEKGESIGALVVMDDVTALKRLELVRRDFVANVSHELKTPITSIKGFVETLLDGALKQPADAERFLRIIAKQSERLVAIIEDLLLLSKLEQEPEKARLSFEPADLLAMMKSAVEACEVKASGKRVRVEMRCEKGLRVPCSAALLEQALINLIDNAIKYSEPESTVEVEAAASPDAVSISVRDRGCGIPPEHLSRLFERFYRVDKARSRTLGGTGLGLAIVKHIAQVHRGYVTVESEPGRGSTFTIHLPPMMNF
jgi:two-component system phosphate regulon sensor histidine kinase PhoR